MEKELAKIVRELSIMNYNIAKLVLAIKDNKQTTTPEAPLIGSEGEIKTHSDK